MDKEQLYKEITRLNALSEKNAEAYQWTGISRYDRAYHKYSEQADVYCVALEAVDEHNELIRLKSTIREIVGSCRDISWMSEEEQYRLYRNIVNKLLTYWG